MKRIGTGKSSNMSDIKEAAIGLAGGVLANQASTMLEKSSVLGSNGKIAPMAVAALSLAAYLFMPKGSAARTMAYGALIVSGTEQVETVTAGVMSGDLTLGFTPRIIPMPTEDNTLKQDGVSIR